ncbi:hypothetical protein MPTK1_4g06635 [Marchantia polymorpha subsp. ruderalis]
MPWLAVTVNNFRMSTHRCMLEGVGDFCTSTPSILPAIAIANGHNSYGLSTEPNMRNFTGFNRTDVPITNLDVLGQDIEIQESKKVMHLTSRDMEVLG